jgi:AcrR family transcriptional regulator
VNPDSRRAPAELALNEELERLRQENERLRAEVERQRPGSQLRERLLDAAREVASEAGFGAELTEIARRAGTSASAIYRHFENREALLRSLVEQSAGEVRAAAAQIRKIEDPEEALREWMLVGFSMVERWGMLAAWVAAGLTPDWARGTARPEHLYRFTGRLLERWRDAGNGRDDMEIRGAVRTWFALTSPFRVRGCLEDGMTPREIADESLGIFQAYYSKEAPLPGGRKG